MLCQHHDHLIQLAVTSKPGNSQPIPDEHAEPCSSLPVRPIATDCTMQAGEGPQEVEEIVREDSSKLLLEGGQQRTVFRLSVEMQRLEAVFNYETGNAPPLGSISVQVCACAMLIRSAGVHPLLPDPPLI